MSVVSSLDCSASASYPSKTHSCGLNGFGHASTSTPGAVASAATRTTIESNDMKKISTLTPHDSRVSFFIMTMVKNLVK